MPYTVATDMDAPNPDSGEEWYHTNTQLFDVLDEHNRFKIGEGVTDPWNAPPAGATPNMDGFVTDYISTFTAEIGRQPTYGEYSQIMTGYTPEQVPVLNGIAREFGVFDHWFSEVPSQTFMNRSFWTAATSSGLVVNAPAKKWLSKNDAETIFERLEQHGRTWKIYVKEPMPYLVPRHHPLLPAKDRLATNFVPFAQFEKDAAAGTLPDFSLIEPNLVGGHGDYHPAFGRALGPQVDADAIDPPSSILAGEAFLARIFETYRSSDLGVGLERLEHHASDRLGRAGRHLRPRTTRARAAPRPRGTGRRVRLQVRPFRLPRPGDPRLPLGSGRLRLQRRVPPHLAIATLRKVWKLGEPLTQRDASARTFDDLFTLDRPRNPETWATVTALPVPKWHLDEDRLNQGLSSLGKTIGPGIIEYARENGVELPPQVDDPDAELTPAIIVEVLREVARHYFPLLAPDTAH